MLRNLTAALNNHLGRGPEQEVRVVHLHDEQALAEGHDGGGVEDAEELGILLVGGLPDGPRHQYLALLIVTWTIHANVLQTINLRPGSLNTIII